MCVVLGQIMIFQQQTSALCGNRCVQLHIEISQNRSNVTIVTFLDIDVNVFNTPSYTLSLTRFLHFENGSRGCGCDVYAVKPDRKPPKKGQPNSGSETS